MHAPTTTQTHLHTFYRNMQTYYPWCIIICLTIIIPTILSNDISISFSTPTNHKESTTVVVLKTTEQNNNSSSNSIPSPNSNKQRNSRPSSLRTEQQTTATKNESIKIFDAQSETAPIKSWSGIHAIGVFDNNENKHYLSYQTTTGWCRQTYTKKLDSKFEFIEFDREKRLYFIRNVWQDIREGKWLACGKRNELFYDNTIYVGLWSNKNDRAIWELVPVDEQRRLFKIRNLHYGWLGIQTNDKWNTVSLDEQHASVYRLENFHEWVRKIDPKTNVYYYENVQTGETRKDKPEGTTFDTVTVH